MEIADLRAEMALSLEEFAARIGLASRGRMSVIEREGRCSLEVALRIEKLSGGRIDAANLSDDVRAARAGANAVHGISDNADTTPPSTGQTGQLSGGVGA